jgi:peptide deformylase
MNILKHPDIFLRLKSDEIKLPLTPEDKGLINIMKKTMYENNGIGLAAIQVGYQKRICVMDTTRSQSNPIVIINPQVVDSSEDHSEFTENCLSAPGINGYPRRNKWIKINYICEHEKQITKTFYDLAAQCVQHEIDHMNGKLCIDYEKK